MNVELEILFSIVLDARFVPSNFPSYRKLSVTHSPAQRIFYISFHFTTRSSLAVNWTVQ